MVQSNTTFIIVAVIALIFLLILVILSIATFSKVKKDTTEVVPLLTSNMISSLGSKKKKKEKLKIEDEVDGEVVEASVPEN